MESIYGVLSPPFKLVYQLISYEEKISLLRHFLGPTQSYLASFWVYLHTTGTFHFADEKATKKFILLSWVTNFTLVTHMVS